MSLRVRGGAPDNPRIAQKEYNLACVLAQRDKLDDAMSTLQASINHRLNPDAALHMQEDDDLSPLFKDPRFISLVNRVHEQYDLAREKQSVPPT